MKTHAHRLTPCLPRKEGLLPVNADIPEIDILNADVVDLYISPLGVRGIGEIGMTGVVAAIGNAVYHATGTRVRDLPITSDKLL